MKNKILKKVSLAFLMICMVTPVHADNMLNTRSDMSINIKGAEGQSQLPTKPDDEATDTLKDKDKNEGNLPATGQAPFVCLISGSLIIVGGIFLIHSKMRDENHDNA